MATYFKQRCSKNDKTFWDTIAPFFTDKRNKNANDIVLKDGDDVVSDPAKVTEIFNTYFSNVASTKGFEDEIVSIEDALQKQSQHPSVLKIKMNTPDLLVFNFQLLKLSDVESKLKNIDVKNATGYDKIHENNCRKHTGSCLFPWRMFWIHISHAVNFQLFWNVRNWTRYIKRKTTWPKKITDRSVSSQPCLKYMNLA